MARCSSFLQIARVNKLRTRARGRGRRSLSLAFGHGFRFGVWCCGLSDAAMRRNQAKLCPFTVTGLTGQAFLIIIPFFLLLFVFCHFLITASLRWHLRRWYRKEVLKEVNTKHRHKRGRGLGLERHLSVMIRRPCRLYISLGRFETMSKGRKTKSKKRPKNKMKVRLTD